MNADQLEVDCQTVQARLNAEEELLLLDCREAGEHAFVNLPGSVLMPMSEIQQKLSELEPHRERQIIVYCHHGVRSGQVVSWLRGQGFADAYSMAGGIDEWARTVDTSLRRY